MTKPNLIAAEACCLCDERRINVLSKLDRRGHPLTTVICRGCGLVHHEPLPSPDEVRRFYERDYRLDYKKTFAPKLKHIYRAGKIAANRVRMMRGWLSGARTVLDVGAGGGELCYLMRTPGREVVGIEPNLGYARHASEKLGLNIIVGDYQTASLSAGAFDLVTMFHVLEHIREPLEILRRAHDWLAVGGHLVVEVPNVEALCVTPKNRFHYAHIYNFNLATLTALGERAGFAVRDEFVAADGGVIRAVFQKNATPPPLTMSLKLDGNAEKIETLLCRHTPLKHYLTRHPYTRLLEKLARAFEEYRATQQHADGEALLEFIKASLPATADT